MPSSMRISMCKFGHRCCRSFEVKFMLKVSVGESSNHRFTHSWRMLVKRLSLLLNSLQLFSQLSHLRGCVIYGWPLGLFHKHILQIKRNSDTVDGSEIRRSPVDMVNIPLFTGFHTSQVVQDSINSMILHSHHTILQKNLWGCPFYLHSGKLT